MPSKYTSLLKSLDGLPPGTEPYTARWDMLREEMRKISIEFVRAALASPNGVLTYDQVVKIAGKITPDL